MTGPDCGDGCDGTHQDRHTTPTATFIHVERCDSCRVFEDDLDAAWSLAQKTGGRVFYYQEGEADPMEDEDYDEEKGIHEFLGTYTEGLCIAGETDPWIEILKEEARVGDHGRR